MQTRGDWLEVPVIIHGITEKLCSKSHGELYRDFIAGVNRELDTLGKDPIQGELVDVEWGWRGKGGSLGEDKYLAGAERRLTDTIGKRVKQAGRHSIIEAMLSSIYGCSRRFIYAGINDLFYYLSTNGEKSIRQNVFNSIMHDIVVPLEKGKPGASLPRLSLTFFAHSAGSVIVHDLLYYLFRDIDKNDMSGYVYQIREHCQKGNVRLRKLYTFGSPIAPLAIRSNDIIKRVLLGGEKLVPKDIGIIDYPELSNPRWVNFWSRNDVFAAPVDFLYDNSPNGSDAMLIQDHYVGHGWLKGKIFPYSHGSYWQSKEVYQYIAQTY